MKNKIAFVIFTAMIILPPTSSFAFGEFPLGSQYNPINVKIVEDPQERNDRLMKEQTLRMDAITRDYNNQSQQIFQNALNRQALITSGNNQTVKINPNWSIDQYLSFLKNSGIIHNTLAENDQTCKKGYGLNSAWNGTKNSAGGLECYCISGFQFNSDNTACVAVAINEGCKYNNSEDFTAARNRTMPKINEALISSWVSDKTTLYIYKGAISGRYMDYISSCRNADNAFKLYDPNNSIPSQPLSLSNDQICSGHFGANSVWDGKMNDKGGLECDCQTGYQFNSNNTACVVTPAKIKITRLLKINSTGGDVGQLQQFLISGGYYSGPVNNTYDQNTKLAVIAFQKTKNITPNGILNLKTRNAINN